MIVYVETNYILELAYQRKFHASAEEILRLAERRAVRMALPAYCVSEARTSRQGRAKERRNFAERALGGQVRELSRSNLYADLSAKSAELILAIVKSIEEERRRLDDYLDRLVQCSEVIELTAEMLDAARGFEDGFKLLAQDATVLASVVTHLRAAGTRSQCFLSQDKEAFSINPDVRQLLTGLTCPVYHNFDQALYEIRQAIGR